MNRNASDNLPIYNLKAVVQETGLKPDTLRAWERRYGVPEPERTESGHRLYSQHDIDTLKWLNARLDEGLNISRAVALWQELTSRGQDPLEELTHSPSGGAAEPLDITGPPVETSYASSADLTFLDTVRLSGDQVGEVRRAWVGACLAFNEEMAERALNQAFALFPPELVCMQILQRGLAEIGEGWRRGRVTVQQEHFASSLAMRRIQTLLAAAPAPTRSGTILVACPPEEEHIFSPMLLTVLLRRKGWQVLYLGGNVPIRDLEATVARTKPTLVVLIAQQLQSAASLLDMGKVLAVRNVPMAYGGRIFVNEPNICAYMPGHYLGHSLDGAPEVLEQIMRAPKARVAERKAQPEFEQALQDFQEQRAQIEATVWVQLNQLGSEKKALATAIGFWGETIVAALKLCGPSNLEIGADWMQEYLVTHYALSNSAVKLFLAAYLQAAKRHLDAENGIVVEWLQMLNQSNSK